MSGSQLLDALLDQPDATASTASLAPATIAAEVAGGYVDALMAQNSALRKMDGHLFPVASDAAARRMAAALRASWRQWAADAEQLLAQIRRLQQDGVQVVRALELTDAYGRAMAMLKLNPERIDHARQQARNGEVFTLEEVRRELRLANDR